MIVTEYMENGSLDAFLRVRAPLVFYVGWDRDIQRVLGDNVRLPTAPRSSDPAALGWGSQVQDPNGQPGLPFGPIT